MNHELLLGIFEFQLKSIYLLYVMGCIYRLREFLIEINSHLFDYPRAMLLLLCSPSGSEESYSCESALRVVYTGGKPKRCYHCRD